MVLVELKRLDEAFCVVSIDECWDNWRLVWLGV
jgi:hypothetical protein